MIAQEENVQLLLYTDVIADVTNLTRGPRPFVWYGLCTAKLDRVLLLQSVTRVTSYSTVPRSGHYKLSSGDGRALGLPSRALP